MLNTCRIAQILCIAVLGAVVTVQAVPALAQPAPTAWPMFGQNSRRTGESPYIGPQFGDLKWVAGNSVSGISGEKTAIGQDAIYVDGKAINLDGSLKWNGVPIAPQQSPAVDKDETIYGGSFKAINAGLPGAYVDELGDLRDAVIWSYPTGNVQSSPVIGADGSVVIGSLNGYLYKFNKQGLVWTLALGAGTESNAAIDTDGTIYVGCQDGNLYAVSPSGTIKWKFNAGNRQVNAGPAIGDDHRVYFTTANFTLWAIDPLAPARLRKKWSVSLGKDSPWNTCLSRPAVDNARSTVYCGGSDGLYAYTMTGTRKWKLATSKTIWAQPAIGADGTVYAKGDDDNVYAVTPDGQVRWSATVGRGNQANPVIAADGTLYVGGAGLHAFQDGAVARPTIFQLRAKPNPVPASGLLDLWARAVTGGTFPVQQVDFYWDTNGNGILDPELAPDDGGDVLVGTNNTGPDEYGDWHISIVPGVAGLPQDIITVFAQATEQTTGTKSNVVSTEVTITP